MWGTTRLPVQYVPIRLVSKPPAMAFGPNTHGIRIGSGKRTAVVAFADDKTLLVTDQNDILALAETLWRYEKETGARLNLWKPKAMAEGSWNTTVNMMDVPYCTELTIKYQARLANQGRAARRRWPERSKRWRGMCMVGNFTSLNAFNIARLLTRQNMAHSTNISRLKGTG